MRVYSADGLILRTYRYGEADRIVVFLTEDRGKKRGVAKNATKSRRRFGAALEPLTRGRVAYVEREHRELVRLDRIEPTAMLLGRDSAQTADGASVLGHAAYFAELLDEWSPDGMANERLFRLGAAVGAALGRVSSVAALARYFEYWLLRLEGVYPAIDTCPRCGRRVLGAGAVLVLADRAYVCRECAHGGPKLSADAMQFLRAAATRTPGEVGDVSLAAGPRRELAHAHDRLIATHLEKELRSTRIVKELGPDS
ncbi:MAG TPA: DNA repair protein RecO [Vicinamibacterales bacterium]|nr:DNA repair protein RecO [Vicinamibacterales bacterium]